MRDNATVPRTEQVGVCGVSMRAERASRSNGSHRRAHDAVLAWTRATTPSREHGEWFPYPQVLAHYHAVGRLAADPELVATLRAAHELVTAEEHTNWLLDSWLPATFDQEDGGYESYFGAPVLRALIERHPGSADTATDTVIAAAVAELVSTEAAALLAADAVSRVQRARLRAVLHVLARLGELAPHATTDPRELSDVEELLSVADGDLRLAIGAYEAGSAILARIPAFVRQVVEVTMLPVTRLHDEQMFIRIIQVFESVYHVVADRIAGAVTALADGDTAAAVRLVAHAADRLDSTPVLFRLLTTMPPAAFAVIRDNTHGRSAVQSRPYRLVERLSAPSTGALPVDRMPGAEGTGTTLQDLFRRDPVPALAEQMIRLDAAWRRMKTTHWGITLKIIGTVPGTGGTDGAAYLRRAAALPLFPALTGGPDRG